MTSRARQDIVVAALLLPAVVLAAWQFVRVAEWMLTHGFADLPIFIRTAVRFLGGGPLYDTSGSGRAAFVPQATVFKFPPLYLIPFMPLLDAGAEPGPRFYAAIFWLHVNRYLLVMVTCCTLVGPQRNPLCTALIGVVFLSFAPFQESLYGLTFENLLLCLLTITMACLPTRRRWLGASCIAYAAMAKVFPSPLVMFFIVRKEWRQVLQCGLVGVALLGVSLLVFGVEAHRTYFGVVLPILLKEPVVVQGRVNLALAPLAEQLAVPFTAFRLVLFLASLGILHVSVRRDPQSALGMRHMFGFAICLMLLLMPNCWGQYQLVLLIPIAVLLGSAWDPESPIKGVGALIALLAWAPMVASNNYLTCPGPSAEWLIWLRQFSPLLLWATMGAMLLARRSSTVRRLDAQA